MWKIGRMQAFWHRVIEVVVCLIALAGNDRAHSAENLGLSERVLKNTEGYLSPWGYDQLVGFGELDEQALVPMVTKYRGSSYDLALPSVIAGVLDSVPLSNETLRGLSGVLSKSEVPNRGRYRTLVQRIDATLDGSSTIEPLSKLEGGERELKILELTYVPGRGVPGWYSRLGDLDSESLAWIVSTLEEGDPHYCNTPASWGIIAMKAVMNDGFPDELGERIKRLLVDRLLKVGKGEVDIKLAILNKGSSFFVKQEYSDLMRELSGHEDQHVRNHANVVVKLLKAKGLWNASQLPSPIAKTDGRVTTKVRPNAVSFPANQRETAVDGRNDWILWSGFVLLIMAGGWECYRRLKG